MLVANDCSNPREAYIRHVMAVTRDQCAGASDLRSMDVSVCLGSVDLVRELAVGLETVPCSGKPCELFH
jgi:hypothetical protein